MPPPQEEMKTWENSIHPRQAPGLRQSVCWCWERLDLVLSKAWPSAWTLTGLSAGWSATRAAYRAHKDLVNFLLRWVWLQLSCIPIQERHKLTFRLGNVSLPPSVTNPRWDSEESWAENRIPEPRAVPFAYFPRFSWTPLPCALFVAILIHSSDTKKEIKKKRHCDVYNRLILTI